MPLLTTGTFLWTNRGGKHPLLLLGGFTYSYQKQNADGRISWYCSRRLKGCRAAAISFGTRAYALKAHDHSPPQLPNNVTTEGPRGTLIPSGKGVHPLLVHNNSTYTFKVLSNSTVLWHCSRRNRTGCKAFVKTDSVQMNRILYVNDEHCHVSKFSTYYISLSAKGGKVLTLNGYRFHMDYEKEGFSYWRCTMRQYRHCKCKIRLIRDSRDSCVNVVDGVSSQHHENSDDDVIEVVKDEEPPIEILSDGEEFELNKKNKTENVPTKIDFLPVLLVTEELKAAKEVTPIVNEIEVLDKCQNCNENLISKETNDMDMEIDPINVTDVLNEPIKEGVVPNDNSFKPFEETIAIIQDNNIPNKDSEEEINVVSHDDVTNETNDNTDINVEN